MKTVNVLMRDSDNQPFYLEVSAMVVGDFAVHKSVAYDGSLHERLWTVTHIPSGLQVLTHLNRRKDAKMVTETILERWPDFSKAVCTDDKISTGRNINLELVPGFREFWWWCRGNL